MSTTLELTVGNFDPETNLKSESENKNDYDKWLPKVKVAMRLYPPDVVANCVAGLFQAYEIDEPAENALCEYIGDHGSEDFDHPNYLLNYDLYQLVEYEVWGNEDAGFDVNDVWKTDIYYAIPKMATTSEVETQLKTEEKSWNNPFGPKTIGSWLKKDALVEVELLDDKMIEVRAEETGEPLGRLEKVA